MFASNKPKFTTKVNLQADYSNTATDGLDSLKPKETVLNGAELEAMKKQIKPNESDEEEQLERKINQKIEEESGAPKKDDFIPLKTKSLRSILRQRNNAFSSDSSDASNASDASDEESHRIAMDKPAPDASYPLARPSEVLPLDDNDSSASEPSSSDEEAKWEQHLVERGLSGPTVAASLTQPIAHGCMTCLLLIVAGPAEQYNVVSSDHVLRRLETALNELRVDYDEVGARRRGED